MSVYAGRRDGRILHPGLTGAYLLPAGFSPLPSRPGNTGTRGYPQATGISRVRVPSLCPCMCPGGACYCRHYPDGTRDYLESGRPRTQEVRPTSNVTVTGPDLDESTTNPTYRRVEAFEIEVGDESATLHGHRFATKGYVTLHGDDGRVRIPAGLADLLGRWILDLGVEAGRRG